MNTSPDKVTALEEAVARWVPDGAHISALQANQRAWENFQKFSETYKRIRIGYRRGPQSAGRIQKAPGLFHPHDGTEQAVWLWRH